jgi:nucleotide-binding universal stress UspA family protein
VNTAPGTSATSRVVVGVDGSEPSKHALRWANFLAVATDTAVEAVMCWRPFTEWGPMGTGWATMPANWNPEQDAGKALTATIDEVFGEHRPPGLLTTVLEGNTAKVLLEASADARMLVVGSRGHGGFAGLLLGSVSAACAEHAVCPVLVVHGTTPPPPSRTEA